MSKPKLSPQAPKAASVLITSGLRLAFLVLFV